MWTKQLDRDKLGDVEEFVVKYCNCERDDETEREGT